MTLSEYQSQAMTTLLPSSNNLQHGLFLITGENVELMQKLCAADELHMHSPLIAAGLTCGHFTKAIRRGDSPEMFLKVTIPADLTEVKKEIGDILWGVAQLCHTLGVSLEEVAQMNIDKLQSRKARGVIQGDGDNR